MQESTEYKIDIKFLLELIKNLDDLYETYYKNLIHYCVQGELNKVVKKEPVDCIKRMLNQTLDICLKNESIRKVIINVSFYLIYLLILLKMEKLKFSGAFFFI